MTVLEMMKKDIQSVVGLTVQYDFGGTKPIGDVIADARINEYTCTLDGEEHIAKIYMISFISSPGSFYPVHSYDVKIQLAGVDYGTRNNA